MMDFYVVIGVQSFFVKKYSEFNRNTIYILFLGSTKLIEGGDNRD